MFDDNTNARIGVYCTATGSPTEQAIQRILDIGLTTWETHPAYMPERVCGRVRPIHEFTTTP